MPIVNRTVQCDIEGCEANFTEEKYGSGFPGWVHVVGISNEPPNPRHIPEMHVCPRHALDLANAIDELNNED